MLEPTLSQAKILPLQPILPHSPLAKCNAEIKGLAEFGRSELSVHAARCGQYKAQISSALNPLEGCLTAVLYPWWCLASLL